MKIFTGFIQWLKTGHWPSRSDIYLMRMNEKASIDEEDGYMPISQSQKSDTESYFIKVIGAGKIKISKSISHYCGYTFGFSFDVSWGKYGYIGGVLSHDEARKLALFILEILDRDEEEQQKRHTNYMDNHK